MKEVIKSAVERLALDKFGVELEAAVTRPEPQFGDYATNAALQIAGNMDEKPPGGPRAIAQQLHEVLVEELGERVIEVSVAGPGFLNFKLSNEALWQTAESSPAKTMAGQTVVAEYSDPNPFKPLHAGHLYTTLVGDMIARLVELAGAKTIRINYGGDVGLHVGKSMWAIISELGGELPEKLNEIPENDRPLWLGRRYVEGTAAYESNPNAKQEIIDCNKRVYKLHEENDHESDFARIYWTCREWSYSYFSSLYRQLGVDEFDRYIPESEVTPLGLETVRSQLENGVYQKSDGAVIFDGEEYGLHKRVFISSEGLPTYETKDVGLSLTKWKDYEFDKSIIITSADQGPYMQVVVKSIEQFNPEPAQRTAHLTHGTVKLRGGVKMSSRKGNVVLALDILESARQAGQASGTNPDELTILAAVKYAFAKNRIGSDIIYVPEESIALEGNSGPYLQYAHARARSILRKAGDKQPLDSGGGSLEEGERALLQKISEYPDIVDNSVEDLMPHHICTYLYELAQQFNGFYEKNRVIGDERQDLRLRLVAKYADTLRSGFEILGIHAPERM